MDRTCAGHRGARSCDFKQNQRGLRDPEAAPSSIFPQLGDTQVTCLGYRLKEIFREFRARIMLAPIFIWKLLTTAIVLDARSPACADVKSKFKTLFRLLEQLSCFHTSHSGLHQREPRRN